MSDVVRLVPDRVAIGEGDVNTELLATLMAVTRVKGSMSLTQEGPFRSRWIMLLPCRCCVLTRVLLVRRKSNHLLTSSTRREQSHLEGAWMCLVPRAFGPHPSDREQSTVHARHQVLRYHSHGVLSCFSSVKYPVAQPRYKEHVLMTKGERC